MSDKSYRWLVAGISLVFEKGLHLHVHLGNNALFPRALELGASAT